MLTLAGNEITDVVRATAIQGDGLLNDSSMGMWDAATNLCTNGGFETNTTGWTTGGTNTLAVDTGQFKFGAKSGKATYSNNATLADYAAIITNVAHTVSCWVYIPTAYDGQGVEMRQLNYTVAASAVNANMGLRDQWQRLILTFTPGADVTGNIQVNNTGTAPTATRFLYVDGVQIETGSIATPYIQTDGGTAARSQGRVRIPLEGLFTTSQGWVAFRLRAGYGNASSLPNAVPIIFDWEDADAVTTIVFRIAGGVNCIALTRNGATNVTPAATFVRDDLITAIGAWDATTHKGSYNGGAFQSVSSGIPPVAHTLAALGTWYPATSFASDMDIKWFACGKGILTDSDAAVINAFGNIDPNPRRFPGQCTGFWDGRTGVFLRRN